jgi:hypothetical protein
MRGRVYLSRERGAPLLKFLWTWKLVSTAALARRFFPNATNPVSAYNWLLTLKNNGYITLRTDERGENSLWTLERAGFRAIRDLLPSLREEGYLSEAPYHDWLASAFHLGEWLVERPAGVQTLSEQQLRRLEPEHYPEWTPKDLRHRPDGYWYRVANNGPRTIALEMELTRKKGPLYQSIGSFYGESAQVNRVLWIVRTFSDARAIHENLDRGPGARANIHSFVMLNSFLKQGWSAAIEHGPGKGLSVQTFLQKALGCPENAFVVQTGCGCMVNALLETRRRTFKSATSGIRREV